jgi:hypothetical protein
MTFKPMERFWEKNYQGEYLLAKEVHYGRDPIVQRLIYNAYIFRKKPAIIYYGTEFTWTELKDMVLKVAGGLLALLFCYQGLVLGIQKLLQLENYRAIILPLGLLLISLMLYMFPSDLEIMFFERILPFVMLPVQLFFPLLLFIGGKIYFKRQGKPLADR